MWSDIAHLFFVPVLLNITRLYNTAIRLGEVQKSFGLALDPEDYAHGNLKFGLMEVVYEWAKVFVLILTTLQILLR